MDLKNLSPFSLGALGAGILAFILSLFDSYVTVSAGGFGSAGTNAWTSFATLGMLLVVAATALIAVRVFAGQVLPPVAPWFLVSAVAAGVGTFLLILRAFTGGGSVPSGLGVSVGPGWSGWLLFVAGIVLTVCAVLDSRATGEKLPDFSGQKPADDN
ncbi:hypothetical protein BHE97_09250 [Aeromicrobium sp. PE09-221]|uniref:hypothetical protein n=1 Tax=Aeromicrobium sp. PE09-221 TaxID=1898043 RepID=UPI000B3E8760|nr:hypothetical protein [Aeromicrobium sp. PE09-221]OUZ09983.1 hypothetical protein BHE97_09250 [Aeromicrobium sp. PE09-221]